MVPLSVVVTWVRASAMTPYTTIRLWISERPIPAPALDQALVMRHKTCHCNDIHMDMGRSQCHSRAIADKTRQDNTNRHRITMSLV